MIQLPDSPDSATPVFVAPFDGLYTLTYTYDEAAGQGKFTVAGSGGQPLPTEGPQTETFALRLSEGDRLRFKGPPGQLRIRAQFST